MASRFVFTPYAAEFPATNFPELSLRNRRPILGFDDTTNETCQWTVRLPDDWDTSSSPTAIVAYIMASAVANDVDIDVYVEAISDGDAFDMDGDSFAAVNSTDNTTVPGTAGFIDMVTVTLTNHDTSVAGDYARFRLTRDAASDTAAGDMDVLWMEIRDAA
jgi:hypothetical protein